MKKINCWEFKKCGREPGGELSNHLGICPASVNTSMNGLNGGKNGGRICWLVAGTFGKSRASYADCVEAEKLRSCLECEFHNLVLKEEGYELHETLPLALSLKTQQKPF